MILRTTLLRANVDVGVGNGEKKSKVTIRQTLTVEQFIVQMYTINRFVVIPYPKNKDIEWKNVN